ncbi:uncharacterized protein A4U43_C05F11630 [Asparagus officinalis]|uniref:Uncharacterized protein n=1 Tax=Asparagus officinalis TaxID=4686 RepID=A0A5P1ETL4_ASPOF|nr:uncharacterized protein A4U43_C05F11630 [Asparagus officinalis]
MAGSMEMTAGMEPTEKARSWVDLWVRASRARVRCGWPRVREMREPSTGRPLGPRSWVCPIWVRLFSASTSAAPPAPPSVPTSCSYSCATGETEGGAQRASFPGRQRGGGTHDMIPGALGPAANDDAEEGTAEI